MATLFLFSAAPSNAQCFRTIAQAGQPAPGNTGSFVHFGQRQGVSPAISGDNIAFGAKTDNSAGIYAFIDGQLLLIADLTTLVPGTNIPFAFDLHSGSSPDISGANVAFTAIPLAFGASVWAYINGSLRNIASRNTPVPGGTGTFMNFGGLGGSSPAISGENVAFVADTPDGEGVYAYINGELRVIADTNTLVPGKNVKFTSFGASQFSGASPDICGENVAFGGTWPVGGSGYYTYVNGELRVIAETGTPRPNGGTFGGFLLNAGHSPSLSGENVAFRTSREIWAYLDGSIRLIVDGNSIAPGTSSTFFTFWAETNPGISGRNITFPAGGSWIGQGIFVSIDDCLDVVAHEQIFVPGTTMPFRLFNSNDGVSPAISGRNVAFAAAFPAAIYLYTDAPRMRDLRDYAMIQRCYAGPGVTLSDPCCRALDYEQDNDLDLNDFAQLFNTLGECK